MKIPKIAISQLTLAGCLCSLVFSCSKDNDLLSEYVVTKDGNLQSIALMADDRFFISNGQANIVMDVLSNDSFDENAQVSIISTTVPQNGEVTINADNTLTYTPQSNTEPSAETSEPETGTSPVEESSNPATAAEEDTFTYTTEVTTPDNEVSRQEATVAIVPIDMGELLAFPGAEGFGKNTTGGRGGKVIHVTNLNDSGTGSLREALEQKGPRTVVFDVGGDIFLTGMQLAIGSSNGDLTIAGETAPFPGITVRGDNISDSSYGGTLDISGSNIIIRYISVRENNNNRTDNDAIRLRNVSGMRNIILDHVSMSNGSDENFSVTDVTNATVQNCMLTNSDTAYNFLFATDNFNFSFIANYNSHTQSRNALVGFGINSESSEWLNNIFYGYEGGMNMVYGNRVDVIGNIYKSFVDNLPDYETIKWNPNNYNNPTASITNGAFYVGDNFQLNPHKFDLYGSRVKENGLQQRAITNSLVSFWVSTVTDIEERVFGRNLPGNSLHQDKLDEEAILDYFNNTGSFSSLSVPSKERTSRPNNYDTDRDGMADEWERSTFGDLSRTPSGDENGDGYTNLETFFFSLIK